MLLSVIEYDDEPALNTLIIPLAKPLSFVTTGLGIVVTIPLSDDSIKLTASGICDEVPLE